MDSSIRSIKRGKHGRSSRGQAVSVLIVFLAVFVVGPLAFLSFEFSLYCLAKQQLKACVESCALTAAATVASWNKTDPAGSQNSAINTAVAMFQQNSIVNQSLANTAPQGTLPLTPDANCASLNFQFLDPLTRQPVPIGSPNGKIVQVTGGFGFVPLFQQFLKLDGVFTIIETSNGGLPMLDVILCFDISGSMDDFTLISAVNRYNSGSFNGYGIISQGPLYNAFQCTNATGTPVNATFPQELETSSGSNGSLTFSASGRGTNCGAAAGSALSSSFTDLVVNIDGTNTFSQGITVNSGNVNYVFPAGCVGSLVEAARGNLESTATAQAAHVPYTSWGITPKAGYFNAYTQSASAQRHPIADAIIAATNFFAIMNNDCDAHFGLVTFSSNVGSSATSTVPADYSSLGNITDDSAAYASNNYPADPCSPTPPNPTVPLNPAIGTAYNNFPQVTAAVQPLLAYGGTNIAGALKAAVKQMQPASSGGQRLVRPGSTKAIVLFTDGLPTMSSLGGNPLQDARTVAYQANQAGIPIYCIGLCLVPSLQSAQSNILTDANNDPNSGGIAGISGNGAKYYQTIQTSQLDAGFENVARSLVQLVH